MDDASMQERLAYMRALIRDAESVRLETDEKNDRLKRIVEEIEALDE